MAAARLEAQTAEYAPAAKLHLLLTSPLSVATIFLRTGLLIPSEIYGLIGRFGLDDINPSPLLHGLVILWCTGIIYLDRIPIVRNASLAVGTVLLLTFLAQCFAVAVTIWIAWSGPGEPLIHMQGRYFLPALVCGVLGVAAVVLRPFVTRQGSERSEIATARMPRFVAGGAVLLLAASLASVMLGEFYGIKTFNKICLHELCAPD